MASADTFKIKEAVKENISLVRPGGGGGQFGALGPSSAPIQTARGLIIGPFSSINSNSGKITDDLFEKNTLHI